MEQYDRGINYEIVCESINGEISRHMAAARDQASPDLALHDAAVKKLIAARNRLNPDDTAAIEVAGLIMDSYRDKIPEEAR